MPGLVGGGVAFSWTRGAVAGEGLVVSEGPVFGEAVALGATSFLTGLESEGGGVLAGFEA